ncbi:MAG TPA: TIR domain-containing protein, partial [Xanthobacteraceae bacterium]|nr:TIR domain-containing protein [Xanthobacteraceae bacterium]
MSKVFLAYKSTDRERASVVRAKLEALDVPLFISPSMASGENYIRAINEQLNSASVVLVLWTEAAVRISAGEPNFLLSEAQRGYARGILVAATFEKIALDHLPVPFNLIQAPDLSDWIQSGASAKHAGWQRVLDALGRRLNRPGLARLAIALESNDDELKKEFLRGYPEDPYAHKAAYLWDAERETPEERKVASPNASQTRTEQEPYKIKATKIGKRPRRRPRRRVTLAKGAPKVFISYRRDDSAGHAGRVHDRLEYEFGRDLLFMDVDSVPLGINFIRVLRDEVAKCDVLLAVIGPNWLTARDDEGNRP